jgi:hypothetical protein
MKTASFLRLSVALLMMTAISCSDPIEQVIPPPPPPPPPISTDHGEYHTSVTTWTHQYDGKYVGLVIQTAGDLSTVDVFILKNGKRISIDREFDATNVQSSFNTDGEYIWATHQNNVLLLNYIGMTEASTPPFPLDIIIVY